MKSSQYKQEAKKSLHGKWLQSACITLLYFLIIFILEYIQKFLPLRLIGIISILLFLISIPLGFGYLASLFNIYNNKENNIFSFFTIGFNNFGKAWSIFFYTLLRMIIPIIIIFVSLILLAIFLVLFSTSLVFNGFGTFTLLFLLLIIISFILYITGIVILIVKSYSYPLSYIIAVESPNLTTKEILDKSEKLMKNKRAKLFCLQLSFIGWAILAFFTLGIGYLFLLPYYIFTTFIFYKNISKNN